MCLRATVIRWLVIGLMLGVLGVARTGRAAREESAETAEFWTPDRVHTIHIRITPQQWQMIQPLPQHRGREYILASAVARPSTRPSTRPVLAVRPPTTAPVVHRDGQRLEPNFYGMQFAYVKAAFECDGVALKDVGFRQRGNSSYNWGVQHGYARPYKVDFNYYVEGQKFHGLTAFFLNNNAYDPSFLRETLAYELFRELGVPAPRTTFALVYLTIDGRLDREYLGLYTLIEEIDSKAFLKNHFGSAKGFLMKPWSIRGLPYMGEQWEAYENHYNSRTDPTPETARRTIDFVKLVNYADDRTFLAEIEDYLNVDEFLRLVAGNVILSNLDTIFYTGHNFYMYLAPDDQRFYLMPWDMNLSFANFTSAATVEQHIHLSMMRPHIGEMKLIDRLLAVPRYERTYRELVREAIEDHFNPRKLFPRIDALQAVLAKADAAADEAWKAKFTKAAPRPTTQVAKIPPRPIVRFTGWQGGPAIGLKTFVTRRLESLNAQLAGETDGFTPGGHRAPVPPPGGLRAGPAYGNLPLIAVALTRAADSDCDSKLTRAEMAAAIRQFFAEADVPRENWVDQAKLAKPIGRSLQSLTRRRREERGNRAGARQTARPADPAALWAGAILKAVDREKTGHLTLEQLLAAADQAFTAADRDKSGKVDESELLGLLDLLAAPAKQ